MTLMHKLMPRRWFAAFQRQMLNPGGSAVLLAVLAIGALSAPNDTSASERILRVLLASDKVYPILKISATGANGTATSLDVAECPTFDDPLFKGAFRFEVELMMICNVVHEADLADRFEFVGYPNLRRAAVDLVAGRADVLGDSVFSTRIKDGIRASDPVLRLGEFQVGVFTTPDRQDILGVADKKTLRSLTGITAKNWELDLKTLNGMGLSDVVTARNMSLIPSMIAARRADFTLSYLDRETTDHMGERLVRVDGFRVSLNRERVFAFSPANSRVEDAMNAFIRKNRKASVDRVYNGYKNCGFIVDIYNHWLDVTNPDT